MAQHSAHDIPLISVFLLNSHRFIVQEQSQAINIFAMARFFLREMASSDLSYVSSSIKEISAHRTVRKR